MKRLTERFSNGQAAILGCGENCKHEYLHCNDGMCPTIWEIFEKLATYEDAEEQRLLSRQSVAEGGTNKGDCIKHPAHYCFSKYEPKDVIRAWGLNFNRGSAVKYIARAGRKDDILQDLNKAKQFIEFEIEAIEAERNEYETDHKRI